VNARRRADHGRPGMADTLCHLADAREAGAMCALGVTNYNAEQLYAACALGTGVATNQVRPWSAPLGWHAVLAGVQELPSAGGYP
jgi:diketogulonate reductase-like aldo/keto reductase